MRNLLIILLAFISLNAFSQKNLNVESIEDIDKITRFENGISSLSPNVLTKFLYDTMKIEVTESDYKRILIHETKEEEKTLRVYSKVLREDVFISLFGKFTFDDVLSYYYPKFNSFISNNNIAFEREYEIYQDSVLLSSTIIKDENVGYSFDDRKSITTKRLNGLIGGFGIDVSHHQGNINWEQVYNDTIPERLKIAVIKATDIGSKSKKPFLSETYHKNWDWLNKNNKFLFGAYLFYQPELSTPEIQANYFIENVKLDANNIRPIIDIEKYPTCTDCLAKKEFIPNLEKLIKIIEDHYKVPVIIYTYDNYYLKYLKGKLDLSNRHLWLARYNSKGLFYKSEYLTGIKPTLEDKSKVIGWQYSDEGTVKGISLESCKVWYVTNSKGQKEKKSSNCVDLNFIYDDVLEDWLIRTHK